MPLLNITDTSFTKVPGLNFIPFKSTLNAPSTPTSFSGYIPDAGANPENSVHNPYIRTEFIQISGLNGSPATVNLFTIDFSEFTPSINDQVAFTSARVYMRHSWNQSTWFKTFNVLDIILRKSTLDTNPYVFDSFILASDVIYDTNKNINTPLTGGIVNTNPSTPEVQLNITHDFLAPTSGLILTTYALVKFNM